MDVERYRGLRGLVRHVLWKLRKTGPLALGRRPTVGVAQGGTPGICQWCLQPTVEEVPSGRGRWHRTCLDWHAAASGYRNDIEGQPLLPSAACICGQPGEELDHRVAIGVAARLSPDVYTRAFAPANLWWLCHACHTAKTAFDRAVMRLIDDCPPQDKPRRLPKVPPGQMTLFDLNEGEETREGVDDRQE